MKTQICKIGKKIYEKGLAPGTSGNISCRINNKILVTPSGKCLGELTEQDILTTDLEGNLIDGKKKPSSEKFMHYEIYKKRPDINCIIHAHPPKSTALAVMGKNLNMNLIAEAIVILGEVPVVKYETPSTHELARLVAESFINHNAVLMANHGVAVAGEELSQVFYMLETVEFLSEINIITEVLGQRNEIPPNKVMELMALK